MTWEIDADHSSARFFAKQMVGATAQECFGSVSGYLHLDEDIPAHTWMDVRVDDVGLVPGTQARTAPLHVMGQSAAPVLPASSFKSHAIAPAMGTVYKVSGELTVLGTTRFVSFFSQFNQRSDGDAFQRVVLTTWATINSNDFGIPLGAFSELACVEGGAMITLEMVLAPGAPAAPQMEAQLDATDSSRTAYQQAA